MTDTGSSDIRLFLSCQICVDTKPPDISPREYGVFDIGITHNGDIQVWCRRHDVEIHTFYREGIVEELASLEAQGCSVPGCECNKRETSH